MKKKKDKGRVVGGLIAIYDRTAPEVASEEALQGHLANAYGDGSYRAVLHGQRPGGRWVYAGEFCIIQVGDIPEPVAATQAFDDFDEGDGGDESEESVDDG